MMPSSGIRLGRILRIPIYLHTSWFVIFFLISFSLAEQFRQQYPHWTNQQRWSVGIITALFFFASVVIHELGHSIVALRYKIPVVSITLFFFGGLARIGREPESARQEFNIAVAGPITSYILAGAFYLLERPLAPGSVPYATAHWLWQINVTLATFNLVPGFPLDGGRILRAIAWGMTRDFTRATRIASRGGQLFAYVLIFIGIWQALNGNWGNGLWLAFIGWFLLTAAQESYASVAVRHSLQGLLAGDVMSRDLPTVERSISIEDYVHEVLRTGRRCHLVTGNGELVGLMTLHAVRAIPRDQWANTSVQAAMLPRDKIHWARPQDSVLTVLDRMQNEDINQMPVVDDGHVVGLISRDTVLRVMQTRVQLEHLAEQ